MNKQLFGLTVAFALSFNQISAQELENGSRPEITNSEAVQTELVSTSSDEGLIEQEESFPAEDLEASIGITAAARNASDETEGTEQAIGDIANLPDDIQSDGAFRYSLPIQIPAFRNLQPELSLVYNSSQKRYANDGPISGIGWSLSGLSSIERISVGGGIARFSAQVFNFA
ncbi:MAG: SpvB/TcaC N-terminal domain-containing protein [Pseudomonadota bacterium]